MTAITGVATSATGFAGETERGPLEPTLVRSWAEYQRTFGGFPDAGAPAPRPYLAYAVRGFFENGGELAYVARVMLEPGTSGPEEPHAGRPDDPSPMLAAFLGRPGSGEDRGRGIEALFAIPDVSLMVVPDAASVPQLSTRLASRCECAGDRMAILDYGADCPDPGRLLTHPDTAFSATYAPRVMVPAPHAPQGSILVPAVGHVAGIFARVDRKAGVHKAPANEEIAGLSATGTPLGCTVDPAAQTLLNAAGINLLRDFRRQGQGVRLWGARTLSSDPDWRYVPVRRLGIFLEQSIARGTAWVASSPNTEATWTTLRETIGRFLTTVWRAGGLVGRTPADAFFVTCDRTTMTQDDIDSGRIICRIGVAPVRPAEFVVLRIGQWQHEPPDP